MTATRPEQPPISSVEHPLAKLARSLHLPHGRRRYQSCLVEGRRVVEAAAAGATPSAVLHTSAFGASDAGSRALLRRLRAAGAPVREVTDEVMAVVCDTVHPQGIIAVVPVPEGALATPEGTAALILILDAVADPGNAGTLIRVAASVGASVIATTATTDLWAPKVLRAGAGAHFNVPVRSRVSWDAIPGLMPPATRIIATDSQAPVTFWDEDLTGPVAIVVSNEAHGATEVARRAAHRAVRIPQGGGDSLNAGVAGAIVLYEAIRQRVRAGHGLPAGLEVSWT